MHVELQADKSTDNPDNAAIMAARGDYMTESLVGKSIEEAMESTDKTRGELIAGLLRSGHFGPFEHAKAYFAVEGISRVAMAQVTRHRHMSFDVQSQRYVEFSDKEAVVPPTFEEASTGEYLQDESPYKSIEEKYDDVLEAHWKRSVRLYERALHDGVPKEDARFFLPQATPVNMTFSANPRSLMHLFDLRNSGAAQWEAREFAQQVLEQCKEWAPLTFQKYEKHINHNSLRAP